VLRRLTFLVALLVAVVAGVAGASAVLGSTGTDTPPGPATLEPDGSGAAIAVTASDPVASRDGTAAPRWAVRVYRSQTGLTCPDANRTVGGDYGRVDGDGSFHPLALDASGDCAQLTAAAPYELVVRHFGADGQRGARAVVFGVVTGAVTSIALDDDGATRDVPIAGGAYVAAIADEDADATRVTFTLAGGTVQTHALRSDPAVVTGP
jgi:hypothetical protein